MAGSIYKSQWDRYIETFRGEGWPGDEWGQPWIWERVFERLFTGAGSWQRAVEIGQGSGKYTLKVLENPGVSVRAYDVSEPFLEVCAKRCAEHVHSGRLSLRQIDLSTPRFLLDDLQDWRRTVDAVYSIGTFVHIDLQYAMAYLLAAAAVLKPGGKLILTFGSIASDAGFQRMLEDVKRFWSGQSDPRGSGKYEWLCGSLVESLLPRLGFDIDMLLEPESINLSVVATLARPEAGDELTKYL
jgi:SAM-dependent methyltransferase